MSINRGSLMLPVVYVCDGPREVWLAVIESDGTADETDGRDDAERYLRQSKRRTPDPTLNAE